MALRHNRDLLMETYYLIPNALQDMKKKNIIAVIIYFDNDTSYKKLRFLKLFDLINITDS